MGAPFFLKPETLDLLAEQVIIACLEATDSEGVRRMYRPNNSRAPEAVRLALTYMFGGGENYQVIGGWPRCEQMNAPTPASEILAKLRQFETTVFRSEPEAQEAITTMTYDAVVALLTKMAEVERTARDAAP